MNYLNLKMEVLIISGIFLLLMNSTVWGKTFFIVQDSSAIGFTVKEYKIFETNGKFEKFEGIVEIDEQTMQLIAVEGVIDLKSVNTNKPKRDDHLRTGDFFDILNHPQMTFKSSEIEKQEETYHVKGMLTIRGITKSITMTGQIAGISDLGNSRKSVRLLATVEINRHDFKISWNKVLDKGGLLIGDIVTINLDIQAVTPSP